MSLLQVKNAKAGKMKYLIGSGRNKMDWTYAGNVAQVGGQDTALRCGRPAAVRGVVREGGCGAEAGWWAPHGQAQQTSPLMCVGACLALCLTLLPIHRLHSLPAGPHPGG